jgi:hypothetical protein
MANYGESKPPADKEGAHKWWDERVEQVDLATLRCWYQASEFHRERGSSATYIFSSSPGHNKVGPYWYYDYYPTPMPDHVLPRVQIRLAKEGAGEDARHTFADLVTVDRWRKCTKQEAEDAWRRPGPAR